MLEAEVEDEDKNLASRPAYPRGFYITAVTSAVWSVAVAGVELPATDEIKVLGVVLDRRLTFEKQVMMVAQ